MLKFVLFQTEEQREGKVHCLSYGKLDIRQLSQGPILEISSFIKILFPVLFVYTTQYRMLKNINNAVLGFDFFTPTVILQLVSQIL